MGILYVDDPYGQGLYNIISERLGAGTTRIANRGFFYARHGDVKEALAQLNMYDPDVTVLMAFADDATSILVNAASLENLKRANGHKWFFSDSVKDAAVLANVDAGREAQGFYGTAPAQGTGQAFNTFSSRFTDKYKKNPGEYAYTSNAYDAMYLLALSASYSQGMANSVTGVKMAEGLTKVSSGSSGTNTQLTNSNFTYLSAELAAGRSVNVDGASGPLDFDASGEAPAPWSCGRCRTPTSSPSPPSTRRRTETRTPSPRGRAHRKPVRSPASSGKPLRGRAPAARHRCATRAGPRPAGRRSSRRRSSVLPLSPSSMSMQSMFPESSTRRYTRAGSSMWCMKLSVSPTVISMLPTSEPFVSRSIPTRGSFRVISWSPMSRFSTSMRTG